jgi:GrpB-like predicted nucleotidyltransferase (UPF0157 family)
VDLHTPRTGELERDPSLDERLDSAVRIVSHDPAWAGQAREELGTIKDALGLIAVRLEHVGSTAVAGLAAKPILDLQLSVRRVEPRMLYAEALGELGYRFVADPASPDYHLFAKPAQRPRSHHLHVCEAAGEHELRHLAVRDFLRAHSAEATRYGALKRELVRRAPADRLAYIAGKKHYTDELQARALAWATAGSTSSLPADVRKAQDLGGAGSAG